MRCHYVVFELDPSCTLDEIKKQYKKLALRYHPDRNHGNEEVAAEKFKELATAYAVLSDPQERGWYDDHRDSILKGSNTGLDEEGESLNSECENLWPFFNTGCFDGYNDSERGFYTVYRIAFSKILSSENVNISNKRDIVHYPSFGTSATLADETSTFYDHWSNFVTRLSFGWANRFNPNEAPNRDVKRAIEKDNKIFRETAKKEYNELVSQLVSFVRKRDPRIQTIEEAAERRLKEHEARRLQRKNEIFEHRRLERELRGSDGIVDEDERRLREQERMTAFLLADENSEESSSDGNFFCDNGTAVSDIASINSKQPGSQQTTEQEEQGPFNCAVCSKLFVSSGQLAQHLTSKVHRKKEHELIKASSKGESVRSVSSPDLSRLKNCGKGGADEVSDSMRELSMDGLGGVHRIDEFSKSSIDAKGNLNSMERIQRLDTNEEDHKCRDCGWSFPTRYSLFSHLKKSGHQTVFDVKGALPPSMTAISRSSEVPDVGYDMMDIKSGTTKKKKKKGNVKIEMESAAVEASDTKKGRRRKHYEESDMFEGRDD